MSMIIDPTDPERAIVAASGGLATQVFLVDPDGTERFVAHGDPDTMFDVDHPPTEESS